MNINTDNNNLNTLKESVIKDECAEKSKGGKGGKSLDNEGKFITNFNTNIEYRNFFINKLGLTGDWNAKYLLKI